MSVKIQFDRNSDIGVPNFGTVYLPKKAVTICVPVHEPGRKILCETGYRYVICAPRLYRNWVLICRGKPRLRSS